MEGPVGILSRENVSHMTESPPRFYLSAHRQRDGEILIKPKVGDNESASLRNLRFRSGSQLCEGKVLAPITSIVLNRNHLGLLFS